MEDLDPDDLVLQSDSFERNVVTPRQEWDDDVPDPEASTYPSAITGPEPIPEWVITEAAARQFELGAIKSGKEAEVFLVERRLGDRSNLLAAKRYRAIDRRSFRNDVRYRNRRQTGNRRADLAIARGSKVGKAIRAQEWAAAEFDALCRLWELDVPVPYPVQLLETEVMLEFLGDEEHAAPRLADTRLKVPVLADLAAQAVDVLRTMTSAGIVHGDLSAYNTLVWDGRLFVIDLPQVGHTMDDDGVELLSRDVSNLLGWFERRGVAVDPPMVLRELVSGLFEGGEPDGNVPSR